MNKSIEAALEREMNQRGFIRELRALIDRGDIADATLGDVLELMERYGY